MSSNGEFIVKFIAEAAGKAMSAVDAAKKEIGQIDEKLQEAERLKLRRMNLLSVLEHFGDDTYRRRRNVSIPASEDIDDSSPEFVELREKIIDAVAAKGPLNVRELILEVGSYDEDILINRTVKMMGDQEIIARDTQGRIVPGKNWQQ